jgi:hypothetical protein
MVLRTLCIGLTKMKTIPLFVFKLLSVIALEYLVLLVISLMLWPLPDDRDAGFFQSSRAPETLFRTEPKYVVYGRKALEQDGPMVIILGSSNAAGSIHLERFRGQSSGSYVANVSIPGSNVTQIAQVYNLVSEIIPPERRGTITYVIGIWYGIFGSDASRWKGNPTDIEIELARYGFYQKSNSSWTPLISVHYLDVVNALIRPFLILDKEIKGSLHPARVWFEKGSVGDTGRTLSSDEMTNYVNFWKRYLNSPEGHLEDEQFSVLEALVRSMIGAGSRVILVEMPIPDWHKNLSPFQANYVAKIAPIVDRLRLKGVEYFKINGNYKDVDFIDEVHPVREIGDRWSAQIAQALHPPLVGQ